MKIIINEKNRNKIEEAVKKAQGRATARTICAESIYETANTLTKKLGIAKKNLVGIKAEIDLNAHKLPNAYKWIAMSTHFQIERVATGWALTDIHRGNLWQREDEIRVELTDKAKEAIIKKYESMRW